MPRPYFERVKRCCSAARLVTPGCGIIAVQETQNGIAISPTARRITLERVRIRHSLPHTSAAAPADIAISGTQILIDRCSVSGKGVWPVVTQNGVTEPNVVL